MPLLSVASATCSISSTIQYTISQLGTYLSVIGDNFGELTTGYYHCSSVDGQNPVAEILDVNHFICPLGVGSGVRPIRLWPDGYDAFGIYSCALDNAVNFYTIPTISGILGYGGSSYPSYMNACPGCGGSSTLNYLTIYGSGFGTPTTVYDYIVGNSPSDAQGYIVSFTETQIIVNFPNTHCSNKNVLENIYIGWGASAYTTSTTYKFQFCDDGASGTWCPGTFAKDCPF